MKFTGERCIPGIIDRVSEEQHFSRYKFASQFVKNKKVLDFGCGSGYGSALLAGAAAHVTGVDISQEAIDHARDHYQKENNKFFTADVVDAKLLESDSFDVVVSFEVIEHLPDRGRYLREACRLLKPGGVFIVSTPNKKYSSPGLEKPSNPYHVIEFYLKDFKDLLSEHFGKIEIHGQDPQSKIKLAIKKFLPEFLLKLFIYRNISGVYNTKQAVLFTDKNVEACRYFIAVCQK